MSNSILEEVTELAKQLPLEQKRQLIDRLTKDLRESVHPKTKPQSLRGVWQGRFPAELDLDVELQEIRRGWEKNWPEVFGR